MKKLLKKSHNTPEVYFQDSNNTLFIKGRSIPENAIKCYEPVLKWLLEYIGTKKSNNELIISIYLDYFNTSTAKYFVQLFKVLENTKEQRNVYVNWFYDKDDDDLKESILEYRTFTSIPIKFQEVDKEEEEDVLNLLGSIF